MDPQLQWRAVLDALPGITFTASLEGNIEWVCAHWYAVTGTSREEVLGEAWTRIIHPDDIEMMVWHWTRAIDRGTPFQAAVRVRFADGRYRWLVSSARREAGLPGGACWVGMAWDLTTIDWSRLGQLDAAALTPPGSPA